MNQAPKKTRRRVLAVVLLASLLLAGGYYLTLPMRFGRQLEAACAGADRVVVDCNTWAGPKPLQNAPSLASYEIGGQDKAIALLRSFKPKSYSAGFVLPIECKCDGDLVFRFCRGGQQLAAVSYKHRTKLHWVGSTWQGDVPLTPESCRAIEAWIAQNTGHPLTEILDETSRRWTQWSDKEENARKLREAESQPSATQPA